MGERGAVRDDGRERDNTYRLFKATRNPDNGQTYTQLRNDIKIGITKAREDFTISNLQKYQKDHTILETYLCG